MKKDFRNEKLRNLKIELEKLEQEEKELIGLNRKSYEIIKMGVLIILLICVIFETSYIKDSIDLGAGTLAADIENIINDDIKEGNENEDGPYQLDENNTEKISKKNKNPINDIENIIENITEENKVKIEDEEEIITEQISQEELKDIKIIQEITNNSGKIEKNEFSKLETLEIFKNSEYFNEKLIYPGLSGKYKFYIENYINKNIEYRLTFSVENDKNINIKYKLKRNGKYIVGDDNTYVNYTLLTKQGLKIKAKQGDIYTLEWKWIEAANDNETTSAKDRGKYKLVIKGEI